MKTKKPFLLFPALVLMFSVFGTTAPDAEEKKTDETPLSVDHVTDNADVYHRKVIKTEGNISSEVETRRFKGKDYTVFKMKGADGGGTVMLVYLRGTHDTLKKGDRLSIRGRFYKERKYLKFIKLKNVLKGREFEVLS